MEILERRKTTTFPPSLKQSHAQKSSSKGSDNDYVPSRCPIGNKKQKAMAAIESKAEEWIGKIAMAFNSNETNDAMLQIMQEDIEQSKTNREFLSDVFTEQTEKLQKTAALKALTQLDLLTMSAAFQEKAKCKIEEGNSSILTN